MTTTEQKKAEIKRLSIETWDAHEQSGAFYSAYEDGFEGGRIGQILDRIERAGHYPEIMEEPRDSTATHWNDYFEEIEANGGYDRELARIKREAAKVAKGKAKAKAAMIALADAIRAEADKL